MPIQITEDSYVGNRDQPGVSKIKIDDVEYVLERMDWSGIETTRTYLTMQEMEAKRFFRYTAPFNPVEVNINWWQGVDPSTIPPTPFSTIPPSFFPKTKIREAEPVISV